jgi:acyl-CoA dehydrogenase
VDTSTWLGARLAAGDIDEALAGATPYLRQFGTVIGGWLMARSAIAAKASPAEHDDEFLADKVVTTRFYGEHLLPQASGLIPTIKGGNELLAKAQL